MSVSVALVAAASVAVTAPPGAAAAPTGLATVAVKPHVQRGARAIGRLAGATLLHGTIALKPRNAAELSTYAAGVTSPNSPLYQHYLAKGEFAARYAPARSTVAAVVDELHAAGITKTAVASNGMFVRFTTSATRASAAFHTGIERYRLESGRVAYAPDAAVRLSAAVAASVQSVVGLQSVVRPQSKLRRQAEHGMQPRTAADARPRTSSTSPVACAAATGIAKKYDGLTDRQIADDYGLTALQQQGRRGAGQTVAIFEAEPFLTKDLQTFDTCYFGAARTTAMLDRVHHIQVDGGSSVGSGEGEAILDMEDVSAMAPDATLDVYEAPISDAGLIDEYAQIVQDDTAKIVSSSWGLGCESFVDQFLPGVPSVENAIFEQAAVQGQTIAIASGDSGSDECSPNGSPVPTAPVASADNDSSQPYVLSVGGTTITDSVNPPTEKVWNDGNEFGAGGGGISQHWSAPTWQANGAVPGFGRASAISSAESVNGAPFCSAPPCREGPDVSAQADEFQGAITVYMAASGGWTTFGGTSSATPLWAGMLADIAQTDACIAQGGLGFVLPTLYRIAADPSLYRSSFNDVTAGNNDQYGASGGLFAARTGFDLATGLGTPRITSPGTHKGLAYALCTADPQTPTVTGVAPAVLPQAGGSVTLTGTGFENGSTPDVLAVQVGDTTVPASAVTVASPTSLTVTLPAATTLAPSGLNGSGLGTHPLAVTLTNHRTSALNPGARVVYYATDGADPSQLPSVTGLGSYAGSESGGRTIRIYGSGFSLGTVTPTVTFGGVAATAVTVESDHTLQVTVPPYSATDTTCATALDPASDICQTQIVVTTSNGSSATSVIKPEFAGNAADEGLDDSVEVGPADTEFDYVPTPHITAITIDSGLAASDGGSTATIKGVGLGFLGTDWYDVGDYTQAASENFGIVAFGTGVNQGRTLTVTLPEIAAAAHRVARDVTVQTEGSPNIDDITATPPSNVVKVTYAAVPTVTSVQVIRYNRIAAHVAGPNTGGTRLILHGKGLADTDVVSFLDIGDSIGGFGDTTAYVFTSATDTTLTLHAPAANPGTDLILACSVSGCSMGGRRDVYTYYPVGQPQVTASSPKKGTTNTRVTITGKHLGFVTAVYFGSVRAKSFRNAEGLVDSGDPSTVYARAPKGKKGSTVSIRVTTLESTITAYGRSHVTKAATFTYK